jgi:hypothetical protein
MIVDQMKKTWKLSRDRGWDKTYWFFDLHETILKPTWSVDDLPRTFYPKAKETLQLMSQMPDICMCLWTCSWPDEIVKYQEFFTNEGINFDYTQGNPEVVAVEGKAGYYVTKPYQNVLFEDKAGFVPEEWDAVGLAIVERLAWLDSVENDGWNTHHRGEDKTSCPWKNGCPEYFRWLTGFYNSGASYINII